MLPYQPNSDPLLPPLVLPALRVDPLCPLPLLGAESFFASTILAFFSAFTFAFVGLDLPFAAGFGEAFATSAFLGVDLAIGFGVVLALNAGVVLGFGSGVGVAVGFGVAFGNSISLFTVVATGFSVAASSCSDSLDSVAPGCFGVGDSCFPDSSDERSAGPPNHTMLSGLVEALAATLQRISPAITAACAKAIKTTFPQKRPPAVPYFFEGGPFAIYFGSALVAM